jgi:L-rhamnose mutarotase
MKRATVLLLSLLVVFFAAGAQAQDVKKYKEGQVTNVSYIKVKPGHFDEYMAWLAGPWKTLMEARKKANLITGYAIYNAQPKGPHDPDLILTETYLNMAALDKIDEDDAVTEKVMGNLSAQNKALMGRESMREVLGSELVRELILK